MNLTNLGAISNLIEDSQNLNELIEILNTLIKANKLSKSLTTEILFKAQELKKE